MSQTETVNGAEALLELFRTQGADYIFCSPIAAWAPLWEALAKRKATTNIETPKYLNCRHEILAVGSGSRLLQGNGPRAGRAAAHRPRRAARRDGGAFRLSRTYSDGDHLARHADPWRGAGPRSRPRMADAAGRSRRSGAQRRDRDEVGKGGEDRTDLAADVRRAWYFAESVPRGPTLLGVPFDILMSQMDAPQGDKTKASPLVAPTDSLREVADLLMRSRAPLIVTEHAARTPQDQAALVAIAEHIGAPVFEYWMPMYVNFPRAHPLYATDPIETHLNDADCILVIGAHGPWHPQETPLPDGCTVIHIEEDPLRPRAPYWGFRTDYCIAGDISSNLAQLAALLQAQPRTAEVTSTHATLARAQRRKQRGSGKGTRGGPQQRAYPRGAAVRHAA